MGHKEKNILIVFLLIIIAALLFMLYGMSYGRYCVPIVKEPKLHEVNDSLKNPNINTHSQNVK